MSKVELFEKERATGYNQFVETWIPNYHYFLDHLPDLLGKTINKNLLVVGCGTGNEMERFAKADQHWKLTGVDPSPDMIRQAIPKFAGNDNVKLIEGVVSDLDKSVSYGAATLLLVLHFLEDDGSKLNLLKDISTRLEAGASLVLLDITGDKEHFKDNLEILRVLLPKNLDSVEVNKRLYRIENDLHPVSEERLIQLLTEAGFETPLRFFQTSVYMGWMTKKK